ncbi:unnamed protein product (macronuclear) [Paramecium tetraurelia]|uniref:MSP domain-containing protein n=1 Tax=Paramecium tetraurelia TaxID=5888 RepID=A0BRM0_PARTE|nr:uncharacterized protein GSPATT00031418001 [Paramecium tetraurelia]CAK61187.1 unnamed protein product [Paramecium tetraurelia]|eukprot:XP_001428585.1 hypothetical protein (macronuclear) [Paramecium tetraurelia strain d4-2]
MELLRLSSNHVEFNYNKYDNMQSNITLYNDTLTPIAFKFKASNRNIFLVRPAIGIVQPKQNQVVHVTLHCKVLENAMTNEFNEKLQLNSIPIFSGIQDPVAIFKDPSRPSDNQKISIAIQTMDKKITSQGCGGPEQVFQSLHKQNSQLDFHNDTTEPKFDQTRFQASNNPPNFELLQQELAKNEQQLLNLQKTHSNSILKPKNEPNKNSKDTILMIIVSIMSFYLILRYFDLTNRIIPK